MSSAGAKIPLLESVAAAVARQSPPLGVIAGDRAYAPLARHVAADYWQMPPLDDVVGDDLLGACVARGIRVVVPTRDGELAFWAEHAPAFAGAGIHVVVSSPAAVELALDKLTFGQMADVPVIPASTTPDGPGPFVVKERFGAGGRGIGLRLSRAEALTHAAGLTAPIFQPFIEGREISIDAWCTQAGVVHGVVLRTRDLVVGGESKVTTTFRDAALESRLCTWLSGRGFRGPLVAQAIVDATGRVHVIEINARFGGASTAGVAVGLDVWHWSLCEALGEPVPGFQRASGDVRQVRVSVDRLEWRA